MLSEIGSTFWQLPDLNTEREEKLWWENEKFFCQFFKSGRNSIKAFSRLEGQRKKKVVLPEYTCETVIKPFADEHWDITFYPIQKDLSIDEQRLREIVKYQKPDVLYVHSYFGFNTLNKSLNTLREIHDQGVIIVEDITQSIFSKHHLEFSDYYVSSLRKFFAIPEGGVLISKKEFIPLDTELSDEEINSTALNAFQTKRNYFNEEAAEKKDCFRMLYQKLNVLIDKNEVLRDIGEMSASIFHSISIDEIKNKRRTNYCIVSSALQNSEILHPILGEPAQGECPLFLPVYTGPGKRKEIQKFLSERQIYCPIIWPKSSLIATNNQNTEFMYENMLCIPIDQRYDSMDMNRIIKTIRNYELIHC